MLGAPSGDGLRRVAQTYIADCLGTVLGFAPEEIDVDLAISNLGFDSMMALELKNRIARDLQVIIPLVRFLEGPSVAGLAVVVATELDNRGESGIAKGETTGALTDDYASVGSEEGTI